MEEVDGIKLAKKFKIPEMVYQGILEHHGDAVIRYFYEKEKLENPNVSNADAILWTSGKMFCFQFYLFSRRISLGPIEKDMSISETEKILKLKLQIYVFIFSAHFVVGLVYQFYSLLR